MIIQTINVVMDLLTHLRVMMVCNIRKSILKYDFNNIQTSKNNLKKLQFFTLRTRLSWVLSVHHLISAYFTPYIRLVKFQLARQIPDFYDTRAFWRVSYFAVFFTEYLILSWYNLMEAYIFQYPSEGSLIINLYSVFIVLFRCLATKTIRQSTDGRMSFDK